MSGLSAPNAGLRIAGGVATSGFLPQNLIFQRTHRVAAFLDRTAFCEKEPQMDDIVANLGLYAAGAFAAGFVFAWIICARVQQ